MKGRELRFSPHISVIERLYISIFGVPINGLRIRLRRVLPHIKGDFQKILDAGCGRGVFSLELAKKFPNAEIIGIDLDKDQIEVNTSIAKKTGLQNLTFTVMDVGSLEFGEIFDCIVSIDNLEHIENDGLAIQGFYKSLRPGGAVFVHVPGRERRWPIVTFRQNFSVPGHFRPGYSKKEICEKLMNNGFNIETSNYTYGFLENLANNISYFITGAKAKNKLIYGFLFPALEFISWFGRNSKPDKGAGVFVVGRKPVKGATVAGPTE